MDIVKRITELKDRVSTLNSEMEKLKGKKEALEDQLLSEFGFDDFTDAQKELEKLQLENAEIEKELITKVEQIEETLNAR
jgi:cell fate (sporulation/competence/biofilm development) regulator YlbF (YheA/YmcA/DUF963 family)